MQIRVGLAVVGTACVVFLCWAPWSYSWATHRAMKAQEAGDIPSALNWYKRSLELGEDKVWCLSSIAMVHATQKNEAEYKKTIETLRQVSPAEA
jgi:hypothetical protein